MKKLASVLKMHACINNTMLYTQLVQFEGDECHSAVARTIEEDRELVEAGFENVCRMDSMHFSEH